MFTASVGTWEAAVRGPGVSWGAVGVMISELESQR